MKLHGNTLLITGGGSGIGRALAESFHALGNQVIIAGRRQSVLDEVVRVNPGMSALQLDIEDEASIARFAKELLARHPKLDAVLHNAGIMKPERLLENPTDLSVAESIIRTNLLGPLRLNAALLPHLLRQARGTILTVSSGLAFIPLAATPTYSATKAAIHSYSQSLRHQLRGTQVQVIEIAPPYVQTELMGAHQKTDPHAMPLGEFISEVMELLRTQPEAEEILVNRVKPLRFAEREDYKATFARLNPN